MPTRQPPSLRAFRKSRAYRAGTLVKRLHLGLTAVVEKRLQEEGLDITRPQGLALMLLAEHPGTSNAELARLNGISPQTMHQTMLRLARDGLVARGPHPRLKRVHAYRVTARGEALMTRGSAVARSAIEGAMRGLRASEQEALIKLLERCVEGLPEGSSG